MCQLNALVGFVPEPVTSMSYGKTAQTSSVNEGDKIASQASKVQVFALCALGKCSSTASTLWAEEMSPPERMKPR